MARTVAGSRKDPTIQFATLTLDGQEYKLAYSFNAIAEAENRAGCNLLSGLQDLRDLNAQQLRGLLYAALSVAHPKITVEEAGDMIRLTTITTITDALAAAYILSLPEKKKSDPPEADPPAESAS